ncbi:MAG: nucleotide sugar dehydrogenase [Acidimicrobiales bacterium]
MARVETANKVVVVGLGYVGLPLALEAVAAGHDVTGYDTSTERVRRLHAAESYVDDVDDVDLKEARETGRFVVTDRLDECRGFDIAIIAVPTPLRDGAPELEYVIGATKAIGTILAAGGCVVLESTTYPGTTEQLVVPLLEETSGLKAGRDFSVGYSPERIDPGNPVWTIGTTPKIVSGIDQTSVERVRRFYATIVDRVVPVKGTKEAELAKLLENTFRHVNIALVNELAVYAHELGIDIWDVIDGADSKPFGFMRFSPGPGVGGHCLPIDPSYLSWQVRRRLGTSFRFIELANDINQRMPDYVVNRIGLSLNRQHLSVSGARILLLGLAYKRNSGDARETPAARVAELLDRLGAELRIADPLVEESPSVPGLRVEADAEEIASADLVVVLTDHDAFDWDSVRTNARAIFDTRHRLEGPNVEHL